MGIGHRDATMPSWEDFGSQDSSGRVLILDEVDALVIDEEPNEPQLGTGVGRASPGVHPEFTMQPVWLAACKR